MDNTTFRSNVLAFYGASSSEKDELLSYNKNVFDHSAIEFPLTLPLKDEPFVKTWKQYSAESEESAAFNTLKAKLVQLSFPIEEGISQSGGYLSATRKGIAVEDIADATGLKAKEPEKIRLIIHQSPAGKIPLLVTENREDFVSLVQALTMKNEPRQVPDSMGASMIAGYNNWDRVRQLREKWQEENLFGNWQEEFKKIIPQKELYQDRFIVLSYGPYSAVSFEDMGLSEEEWKEKSFIIRREHECAHYFTKRFFSSMKNNLIDELIADYMGIVEAAGTYRADWFLRFLGLENFPEYREGGRLQNYRGNPELSEGAFKILQVLVKNSAENLEKFDSDLSEKLEVAERKSFILISLTHLTMEELASKDSYALVENLVNKLRKKVITKKSFASG